MWPCIVDIVKVKNRLDATKYVAFVASTCFEHQYAHRQEYTARRMGPATSSEQCSLQEAQCRTTQSNFQVWPPKSGKYSIIVLLTMGILVPETC
jgi:hypothetical protein